MTADPLRRTAQWFAQLSGFHRALASLLLGFAGFLAMPPLSLVPCFVVSLTGFIWLLDGAGRPRRAGLDAFLWGMGFFVPCLHWIAASMFVDLGQFWWMVPFAVLGLPAFMSLYLAIAMALHQRLSAAPGVLRVVAFAGWWTLAEWLRGHLLSGFPWLLAGYAWSADARPLLSVLQSAWVVGIYNLSFFTVLVCALPAALADQTHRRAGIAAVVAAAVLVAGTIGWGALRLQTPLPATGGARIRIVSSDVPARDDTNFRTNIADFERVLAIARRPAAQPIDAAVWPEGDAPFPLDLDSGARSAVAATVGDGALVLAGTVRIAGHEADEQAWNDVAAVSHSGQIIGHYDKHHLVPFGEYVPLHQWLTFSKIAAQRFDFSTGPGPVTLPLPNLPPVGPIICYEAIFPDEVVDEAERPGWMVNVTDDGWFGRTIGPAQHFAIARVRAVEEGLSLVRAANGGISALVDPFGRTLASSPPSVPAALDVNLPPPISRNVFYVHFHTWLLLILIISSISAGAVASRYLR